MRGFRIDNKSKNQNGYFNSKLLEHTANLKLLAGSFKPRRRSFSISNNSIGGQAMAMQLEAMYLDCLDTKTSITKDVETKPLRDLVLLHLDLIQLQREQLATKDKIIKDLKNENNSLRSRIEILEGKSSGSLRRNCLSALVNNATNTSPIKDEIKEETPNNNNNENLKSQSPVLCSPSLRENKTQSPVLRSQKIDSCSNWKGFDSVQSFSPISSSRTLRNLSPLLKKDENKRDQLLSENESHSSLRHSPRLDGSVVSYTDCNLTIRLNNSFKDSLSEPSSSTKKLKLSKKHISKEKLNKSDSCLYDQSPITLRSQSPIESNLLKHTETANKRSLESPSTVDLVIKKNKKTADDNIIEQNETLTVGDSETLTLRSRDSTKDTASCDSPLTSEESINSLENRFTSGSQSEESDKIIVKSSAENVTKIKENTRVPGCGVRAVRSLEGILTTEKEYFVPTALPFDLIEPCATAADFNSYQTVEIPSWRVSVLNTSYSMEGTENLEDDIFTKRHNKLETDEKRRKRWDLQRLREQRQYEKLKERYEGRNASSTNTTLDSDFIQCQSQSSLSGKSSAVTLGGSITKSKCGASSAATRGDLTSLWPDPSSALYIEISESVPVCAFGQPVATSPASEFSLPWLSRGTQDNINSSLLRKRKK